MSLILRSLAGLTLVIGAWLPSVSHAEPLPGSFSLGQYVPGDVWVYLHGVHNPERKWLEAEWAEVFHALKASGIDHDLAGLALGFMGEDQQASTKASIEEWSKRFQRVDWKKLAGSEYAYAQRVATRPGAYDYFILTRGEPGSGEKNSQALVGILHALADLCGDIKVIPTEFKGIKTWSMTSGEKGIKDLGFSLELIRKGDVIVLTTGIKAREDVLALMTAKSENPSIVSLPRFHEALSHVPQPEDFVSFIDMKRLFRDLKSLISVVVKEGGQGQKVESPKFLAAFMKGMERCDVLDYVISSSETQGRRELRHEVVKLQPSKAKCTVACCGLDRKPFTRFDQFIPAEVTGFSLSGSLNLEATYQVITEFVTDEVPGGKEFLDGLTGKMAGLGFDIQRDLFSWWSGEMIQISLPAAVVTPMGGGQDSVVMIRVKDEQLAAQKIDSFIQYVTRTLESQGQSLMVSAADVRADGFKQVVHPFLAMVMRPVVGVHGDWLMIGTSATAVNKCLAVAKGEAPSVAKNERFIKEGLVPNGPVMAASFTDTSKFGEQLGGAMGMAGFVGGMALGKLQGDDTAEAKKILQKLMTVITKLAPVVRQFDFYSSESTVTTFDGKSLVRTEKVINYKSPVSEEKTAERQ